MTFCKDASCCKKTNLIDLYTNFVKYDSHRFNSLSLADILMACARQHYVSSDSSKGYQNAIDMLTEISGCSSDASDLEEMKIGASAKKAEEKEDEEEESKKTPAERNRELRLQKQRRLGDEALVIIQSHVSWLRLQMKDFVSCLKLIEATKPLLESIECASPKSHRAYYSAAAEYHAVKGPADSYYRNRLQYAVYVVLPLERCARTSHTTPLEHRYTPAEEMDPKLSVRYAQDLCLAALVSDKIYNFGEIVSLPIFNALKEDKSLSWLSDMLQAFNDGDIDKFNNVFADHKAEIQRKAALANNLPILKEKITLLCVMNLIFQRPPSQRNIPFSEIAKATQLELKQVEWVLIRAMSIGLIRGVIDEVDQTVSVTYIRPRVLDKTQLLSLKNRLVEWSAAVEQSVTFMESNTMELFE